MATPILRIKKNNYYSKQVTCQYDDGTPVNLTGKELHFAVKNAEDILPDDSAALIKKVITSFTDAVNGIFTLTINAPDTADLAYPKCVEIINSL